MLEFVHDALDGRLLLLALFGHGTPNCIWRRHLPHEKVTPDRNTRGARPIWITADPGHDAAGQGREFDVAVPMERTAQPGAIGATSG